MVVFPDPPLPEIAIRIPITHSSAAYVPPAARIAVTPNWTTGERERLMGTLRVTVAGKGGVGKTVVSASLARFFGREGHRVLAVDGDSNPVLGVSLGVPLERIAEREPIPTDFWVAVERLGVGRVAVLVDDPDLLTERHGLAAPDNVTLLAAPVEVNEGCTADSGVRSMLGVMLGRN